MVSGNYSSQSYITQSEASILAGVSTATLMRFAEAGYFRTVEQDGITQFSKQEIFDVFGPAIPSLASAKSEKPTSETFIQTNNSDVPLEATEREAPILQSADMQNAEDQNVKTSQSSIVTDNDSEFTTQINENLNLATPLNQKVEKLIDDESIKSQEPAFVESRFDGSSSEIIAESREIVEQNSFQARQAYKKVLQLQEELLAQKEATIKDLIKEREWLRSRLEKMEDKSDRDQMLLMVESQKVRTLIDRSGPKTSIVRLALDWLGGNKLEHQKSAENSTGQRPPNS